MTTLGGTACSGPFLSLSSSSFIPICLTCPISLSGHMSWIPLLWAHFFQTSSCAEPRYVPSGEQQAPFFWLYLVSVTYCMKVPDALEREPLPEAHPALLSHRRGPAGSFIYMPQPHRPPSSGATELLQGLSGEGRVRRTDMEPSPGSSGTPKLYKLLAQLSAHQSEEAVPFSRTVSIETRPHRAALTGEGRG